MTAQIVAERPKIMEESQEWTIDMIRETKLNESAFAAVLVFRLDEQDGIVTGTVSEGIERRFLSTVTGIHQPLLGVDYRFMALDFKWGNADVTLSGVTFETSGRIRFSGRFRVVAAPEVAPIGDFGDCNIAPGMDAATGDTGTATGQQT
jgi:hypothetical protein